MANKFVPTKSDYVIVKIKIIKKDGYYINGDRYATVCVPRVGDYFGVQMWRFKVVRVEWVFPIHMQPQEVLVYLDGSEKF